MDKFEKFVNPICAGVSGICAITLTDIFQVLSIIALVVSLLPVVFKFATFVIALIKTIVAHFAERHGENCGCDEKVKSFSEQLKNEIMNIRNLFGGGKEN